MGTSIAPKTKARVKKERKTPKVTTDVDSSLIYDKIIAHAVDPGVVTHPILNTLNADQIRAATSFAPMADSSEDFFQVSHTPFLPKVTMVLAGAGSGKTRVLVHRIAYLLQELKVNPNAILATTFTNKAAREIKERILLLMHANSTAMIDPLSIISPTSVGLDTSISAADAPTAAPSEAPRHDPLPHWIGTFHSLCYKILLYNAEAADMENCHMIDEAQQKAVVKKLMLNWYVNFASISLVLASICEITLSNNSSHSTLSVLYFGREHEVEEKCKLDFNKAVDKCISSINKRKDNGIRASVAKKSSPFATDMGSWVRDNYSSPYDAQDAFFLLMYDIYEKHCKREKLIDFNEVLIRTQELFMYRPKILERYRRQFQYIHVDEFQDTNGVQYSIIKLLISGSEAIRNSTSTSNSTSSTFNTSLTIKPSALESNITTPGPSLFVVGDDDQAIYGFRGAKADIMQRVGRDYPHSRLIKLEQNYRSTHTILRAANSVINRNNIRLGKSLWTSKSQELDEKVQIFQAKTEYEEAEFLSHEILRRISAGPDAIPLRQNIDPHKSKTREKRSFGLNDIAILVRTRVQFAALEQSLLHNGIPYVLRGGSNFYSREEIQYVLMYLKLLQDRHNNHAFLKVANFPIRGVTPTILSEVEDFANANNISLWEAATEMTQRALNPGHVSKYSSTSMVEKDSEEREFNSGVTEAEEPNQNRSVEGTTAGDTQQADWMTNLLAEIDATIREKVNINANAVISDLEAKTGKVKKAKKVKVKPPPKALVHLAEFLKVVDSLGALSARLPVNDVVKLAITKSGIYDYFLKGSMKDTKQAVRYRNKVENLQEFGTLVDDRFDSFPDEKWVKEFSKPFEVSDFDDRRAKAMVLDPLNRTPLQVFLDDINFDDEHPGAGRKAVQIFTIHGVKGLEFPVVFLCGAEEGILPFRNADKGGSSARNNDEDNMDPEEIQTKGADKGLEESRRLFYVGVTRARELLFISHAKTRMKDGDFIAKRPSMFLFELDKGALAKAQK